MLLLRRRSRRPSCRTRRRAAISRLLKTKVKSRAGVMAAAWMAVGRVCVADADGDHADARDRAQAEDDLAPLARYRIGIDAIDRIVPATSGTTQARKRKSAKYILPRPPNRSKKYCNARPK